MSQEEKLPKILIVEDDERLARLTQEYLIRNGLEVGVEPDGNRAIRRIIAEQPDLVVLDVMLPGADGLTICREVRPHYHQPILMLTARTEDMDQVLGLEMGADDYVAKPVQPRVLLARIRALLRRTDKVPEDEVAQRIEFDDLVIDNGGRSVTLNGELVDFTSAEYDGQDRSIDVRISRINHLKKVLLTSIFRFRLHPILPNFLLYLFLNLYFLKQGLLRILRKYFQNLLYFLGVFLSFFS